MRQGKKWSIFSVMVGLILVSGWQPSSADDHDHKEKSWYHKILDWDDDDDDHHEHRNKRHEKDHEEDRVSPVSNSTYEDTCGGCHFAYPPGLLPSASWVKILNKPDDHFGEELDIDPDDKKLVLDYLKRNSADNSRAKLAVKIMRSLGTRTPIRITDIPHIREEHYEISRNVLERDSIGSLSNCIACHQRADEGIFEDDYVNIPR